MMFSVTFTVIILLEVVVVQSIVEGEFSSCTDDAEIWMKNQSMEFTPQAKENQEIQFVIRELGEVDIPLGFTMGIDSNEEYLILICVTHYYDDGKNNGTMYYNSIRVHERNYPIDLLMLIVIEENELLFDIVYHEISSTLYIAGFPCNCISKVTLDDQQVTRWIQLDSNWFRISLSTEGDILVLTQINNTIWRLEIYGLDGNLTYSLLLPDFIKRPLKAIQTSDGRFIISHITNKGNRTQGFITQLTRDGQFIGHFNPLDDSQKLLPVMDMSLDPDHDLLFVSDRDNERVILLDSISLAWCQVLLAEIDLLSIRYDVKRRQLIVVDSSSRLRIFSMSNKT